MVMKPSVTKKQRSWFVSGCDDDPKGRPALDPPFGAIPANRPPIIALWQRAHAV
jgi:hypothetical protein